MITESNSDDLLRARHHAGGRTVMFQSWRRLLFLHWKCDPATLAPMLPEGLEIETFEGDAYIGIVPFFMCGVRPRFAPRLPGISNFLELNVRTYVRPVGGGPPGVWFFSLDANCRPAVWAARRFFHLPYFQAKMRAKEESDWTDYRCLRRGDESQHEARFRYRAAPAGSPPRESDPGTLDFFLLERYWLYAHDPRRGRLFRGQVNHVPYRVRESEVTTWDAGPATRLGFNFEPDQHPDHQCVTEDVSVKILGIGEHKV